MWFTRRRSNRPDSARNGLGSALEVLEDRALLTSSSFNPFAVYSPNDLAVYDVNSNTPAKYNVKHQLLNTTNSQSSLLGNEGKIVSGQDPEGDKWTIVVHGPGEAIVTDTSPTDGSLDGTIDTIQLVGTNINTTFVTGNVVASNLVQTTSTGTIDFNRLIDTNGVNNITLNGFTLSETVTPAAGAANNTNTGIYLLGGVRYLSFHDIDAVVDASTSDVPINLIIGDPANPLKVAPTIHLDSIWNTAFNSADTTVPADVPVTTPTVNIQVNGAVKNLSFISTTNSPTTPTNSEPLETPVVVSTPTDTTPTTSTETPVSLNSATSASSPYVASAGLNYLFPTVATTGRTALQATKVGTIDVAGAATNFTVSRASEPSQNGFSGVSSLKKATFNGPTDAVNLDVAGAIGSLTFNKGIGNPTGVEVGTSTQVNTTSLNNGNGGSTAVPSQVPATAYGVPADQTGYAANGYVAGQITATKISKIKVKPASVVTQDPSNPAYTQIEREGEPFQIVTPGTAITNTAITTTGSIGSVKITGNSVNSEIKTGFSYPSYAAGLDGTRAPSKIKSYKQNGSLINSVVSATYRPYDQTYGTPVDTAGPGSVKGTITTSSTIADTGNATALDNSGAGVYAKVKSSDLPPVQLPAKAPVKVK